MFVEAIKNSMKQEKISYKVTKEMTQNPIKSQENDCKLTQQSLTDL